MPEIVGFFFIIFFSRTTKTGTFDPNNEFSWHLL